MILADDRAILFQGDCRELNLRPNSVDAFVTDPPSGIGFMGQSWDKAKGGRDHWISWLETCVAPAYDAMKPGAYGLVWALPRTSYWTGYALDNAGFEVCDRVSHLFLTGFPKSLTSKSADIPPECGTALKPAMEDWWLVQKPFKGTYADNFKTYGTGLLNINECRISEDSTMRVSGHHERRAGYKNDWGMEAGRLVGSECGRWPSHLCVSPGVQIEGVDDPAKYFYCQKPGKEETEAGLAHLPLKTGGDLTDREDGSKGLNSPRAGAGRGGGRRNTHPTKKPQNLMEWLITLITPPGGTVLDTFSGSGTTGMAAIALGHPFIGCELGGDNGEYIPIFEGRIRHALALSSK